jgi:hypothetical protein
MFSGVLRVTNRPKPSITHLLFILAALASFLASEAFAQSPSPPPSQPLPKLKTSDDFPKDEQQDGSKLPEEMRVRLEIERADAEHKKVLEDADKLNDLSEEVHKGFQQNGRLSGEDVRKVGTIEKLAKRILSHAGGDLIDDKNARPAQLSIDEALTQLGTAAASIKKEMKAETRFVVSASVISHSNEVINLAQLIRHLNKAD